MKALQKLERWPVEKFDPVDMARLPERVELLCGACGHVADYDAGTLVIHSPTELPDETSEIEDTICFTGYLRCPQCRASGQWRFTDRVRRDLMMKVLKVVLTGKPSPGIQFAVPTMFDGTICRDLAQGEDYLRSLIAKTPDDFFLYSRLANLLWKVNLPELAEVEWHRAVELNPRDAESWYNIGCLHQNNNRRDDAIHAFQQTLRFANQADHVKPDLLRQIVEDSLDRLFGMHNPAEHQLNFLPGIEPKPDRNRNTSDRQIAVVHVKEVNLGSDEGWEQIADLYAPRTRPERHPQPLALTGQGPHFATSWDSDNPSDDSKFIETLTRTTPRIGRNDPCPCGSGNKFKRCCMGRK